jgi:DNA polymerase-3 subunit delta
MSMCLEQAALYAGPDARVEPDHVQAVVPESRERGIFELTKAIGAGQRAQALRLLGNLLRNREPALRIQFMLMRQLRQIWRAKELQAAGAPRGEIAGRVGMSPHFLDDVLVPARKMSTSALVHSFDLLYKADQSLKSSRVDPDIQITRLVTALTEAAAASAPR